MKFYGEKYAKQEGSVYLKKQTTLYSRTLSNENRISAEGRDREKSKEMKLEKEW